MGCANMPALAAKLPTGIRKTVIGWKQHNACSWYCKKPLVSWKSARHAPSYGIMPHIQMDTEFTFLNLPSCHVCLHYDTIRFEL